MFLGRHRGDAVLRLVSHGLYFPFFVLSAVWKSIKMLKLYINISIQKNTFTHTVNADGVKYAGNVIFLFFCSVSGEQLKVYFNRSVVSFTLNICMGMEATYIYLIS